MTNKLFIGNLSFNVTQDELKTACAEYGEVASLKIPTDRETNRPRGFAFVEFADASAAETAKNALNGKELDGRALNVDFAKERAPRR